MKQPPRPLDPPPVLPTLADQKADFTAEGAPAPGRVGSAGPEQPIDPGPAEADPVAAPASPPPRPRPARPRAAGRTGMA